MVGFPARLHALPPRFACGNEACDRWIFHASLACTDDGANLTRPVNWWILECLAVDAVCDFVYTGPTHVDGVRILRVDEDVRKCTRRSGEPSSFVTVLVGLMPLVDGHGPARLLNTRPRRSVEVLRS